MIEFQVYSFLFMTLLLAVLVFILPKGIKEHLTLLKLAKSGQTNDTPPLEKGVSTYFVNIADILLIVLMLAITGIAVAQFANPSLEAASTSASITFKSLMKNLTFQLFEIIAILCIVCFRTNVITQFGLSKVPVKRMLKYVSLTLTSAWAFTALIMQAGYFEYLNDLLGTQPLQSTVVFLQESSDYLLIALLAVCACIGAPLVEELIFRGYLYPVIKHYTSARFGIFFSALFFSLIHFNFAAMPTLFLMGAMLAYAYEKTKTLWTPILAHFIFNSATVCFQILSRFTDINPAI